MIRDLRDLIKGYQGRYNLNGDTCHPLKISLIRSARERDKNNPKLSRGDLSNALKHSGLETKKEKKQQQVSVPCENTAATPVVVEDTLPPETPHAVSRASPAPSSSSVVSGYASASSPISRASSVTTATADSPGDTRAESSCPIVHEDQVEATMEDDSMFVETEIMESLAFVKQTLEQQNVHPESDEYRRILLHHNSRLQYCETTIRNVQKEIEEEFQKATHREIKIRGQLEKEYAEFQELQDKERGICHNVQYYSFIASLLRLGPLGLDSLLFKLRYSGVDVVGEVNKNPSNAVQDHVVA